MTASLSITGLSKTFAGRRVVEDVTFTIERGQIVGLVGQNGCGKSTLIKMLSGVHAPDPGGRLSLRGDDVPLPAPPGGPDGLAFVHQDLGLFLDGTILENIRVGRFTRGVLGNIKWAQEAEASSQALARLGLALDPYTKVEELSQVDRALVAIARAVDQASALDSSGVIVLDEPTSYLPLDGVQRLFAAVRALAASGFGVLFVSHRLDEVRDLCDEILVMRAGKITAKLPASSPSEMIVTAMLGRELSELYPDHVEDVRGEEVLAVDGVSGAGVRDVSFSVRRGEIYGITGLLGMGQERILYLLFGAEVAQGRVTVAGSPLDLATLTPRAAVAQGMALLPADRLRQSSVPEASVLENLTLVTLPRWVSRGRIQHRRERAEARRTIEDYRVEPPVLDQPMSSLSGGNQQKALLAKWVTGAPEVLLLHEPTQGVDIGAKAQIFARLREIADAGTAVVVATTEYEDLAQICDRVMVMREGRAAAELAGAGLTEDRLIDECYRDSTEVTK